LEVMLKRLPLKWKNIVIKILDCRYFFISKIKNR
jgi:hypothetical protein